MSIISNIENMTDAEKLAVLESVQKSIAESKEIQKKKIGENVNLVISALKKIESDIQARYDAIGTTIENRVASIKDGKDGKDGRDGVNGRDGKAGRDGAKGDKGDAGLNGRDGVDGRDGVSVTDAKIDFDGSLVITLSSGQEINVGEVVSSDIAEKIKVINTMSTNAAIAVKEEGSTLTNGVKSINFVGTGITATTSGDDVTVTVASGSGTVTSVAATGGTGISVTGSPITTSGTLTITNTAPDQTVALTSGTGITTSGTYPNFTITNSAPDQTVVLTQGGTTTITGTYPNFTISSADQFQGTVTSVTGTSPVASSGGATPAISLSAGYGDTQNPYASKTANFVLAAPNGSAGVPTFRAIVAADIPTLNQNTTGTASNVTGTVAIANGGTGATTAATALTNLGAVAKAGDTMTGALGFVAGSASTPSLFASGDTNTGIFFPAADTIAFAEGGAEAMRIDSSGNVGIGTSSPGDILHIQSSTGNNVVRIQASTTGTNTIQMGDTSSSGAGYVQYANNGDYMRFATNAAERMRIDSSGNVGIGTSSPAVNLNVAKASDGVAARFQRSSGGGLVDIETYNGIGGIGTSDNIPFRLNTNNTERMRIDSSGNLLVGATSQIGSEKLGVTSGTTNATQYTTIATKGGSTLNVNQQQTTSVSTSATVILASPTYLTFCLVHGSDGTNRFSDVVSMSVGTGTVNVINSLSAGGSPAARTYSQASSTFKLAMASGTYTVQVTALTMNS